MKPRPIYFVKENKITPDEEVQLTEAQKLMEIFTKYASDINNYTLSEELNYVA